MLDFPHNKIAKTKYCVRETTFKFISRIWCHFYNQNDMNEIISRDLLNNIQHPTNFSTEFVTLLVINHHFCFLILHKVHSPILFSLFYISRRFILLHHIMCLPLFQEGCQDCPSSKQLSARYH